MYYPASTNVSAHFARFFFVLRKIWMYREKYVLTSTGCQTAAPYPSSNTFIAAAFPAAPMAVYAPVNMVEAGPSPSCVAWQMGPTANPMADATGGTAGAVPKVADAAAPAAATRLSQSTFLDENEAMRRISALRQQLRDCGIEPCA